MNIHDNNKKHKVHFLTFCAGIDFAGSLQKIHDEAKHVAVFDQIHTMNDIDIQQDTEFWEQHKEFIQQNPRGWGYWLWKSYINLCLIEKINDGDIVVYADGGCELNVTDASMKRLDEYIEMANTSPYGFLSFSLRYFPDTRFTKMDTAIALDANDFMESKQLVGGIFVYKKCDHAINIFKECYHACCSKNYHLITDAPSVATNYPDFQEHRHDQSVFSLLRKKIGTTTIVDETYWGPDWHERGANFPIWARRRRILLK